MRQAIAAIAMAALPRLAAGHSGTRQSSQNTEAASPETKEQLDGQASDQAPAGTKGRSPPNRSVEPGRGRPQCCLRKTFTTRPGPDKIGQDGGGLEAEVRVAEAAPCREIARQTCRQDDSNGGRQIVQEIADRLPERFDGSREEAANGRRSLRARQRGKKQRRNTLVDPWFSVEHQRQRDPQRQQGKRQDGIGPQTVGRRRGHLPRCRCCRHWSFDRPGHQPFQRSRGAIRILRVWHAAHRRDKLSPAFIDVRGPACIVAMIG